MFELDIKPVEVTVFPPKYRIHTLFQLDSCRKQTNKKTLKQTQTQSQSGTDLRSIGFQNFEHPQLLTINVEAQQNAS